MTNVYNKSEIRQTRRALRKNMPTPEIIVWGKIRNRQLSGYKFRRQYSFNNFIVDFYCVEKKLVIEIDGDSHSGKKAIEYDNNRQKNIEALGIIFLRFTNEAVVNNIEGVLEEINRNLT